MLFSVAVLAVSVVSSVLAWGSTNFDVQVGPNGKLVFDPSNITANVHDTVTFHFNPKNHSVTQSSFQEPCTNLTGGFDSGFNPVADGTGVNKGPTFKITVNDTNPIWVHCNQMANMPGSHCGAGMVFAVNPGAPGSANSFQNFLDTALAIGASLQGGGKQTAPASVASEAGHGNATKTGGGKVTPTSSGKVTPTSSGKVTPTSSGKVTPTSPTSSGKVTPTSPTSSGKVTPTSSVKVIPTSSGKITQTRSGQVTTETGTGKGTTETGTGKATTETGTGRATTQTSSAQVTSRISTGQETSSVLSSVPSAETTASAGTAS